MPDDTRLKNIDAIKGSLAKFGQQKPIVIDQNSVVLAGNGTLVAAREMGWTHISAVRSSLESFTALAYALADNRTAELADWDDDVLGKSLLSLKDLDFDLDAIGFDESFFDDDEVDDADEPPVEKDMEWLLVLTCRDEVQQAQLFQEFQDRKIECKIM